MLTKIFLVLAISINLIFIDLAWAEKISSEVDSISGATFNVEAMHRNNQVKKKYFNAANPDLWVALEDNGTSEFYESVVRPTLQAFERTFPDKSVKLSSFPSKIFVNEVLKNNIPYVFASSATMAELTLRKGFVPLSAIERTSQLSSLITGEGAGLVVVSNESKITKIEDLKAKSISVVNSTSFGLLEWLFSKLNQLGIDSKDFFSSVKRVDNEVPNLVLALKEKRVDAALFPLCLLERLEDSGLIKRGSLKPIGVLNSDKSNECKRTTELFPGWMVGYSAFADTDMTRRFAAVIFSFSPDESFRWGFNVDLTPVIGAMERLHYGPFSYLDDTTIIGFLKKREELLIAIAVFLLFVGIHILRTTYIVRVKTRQLDEALRRQIRLEEENKVARKRIERIERVGLLNQMSSMIAHELKQPLASITNYLGGLQIWNEKRNADNKEKEFTKLILDSIGSETQRVADIVERVRGYAKNTQTQFSKVDLS